MDALQAQAVAYLRGDEWYLFSRAGLIREIRAYYACPRRRARTTLS